MNRRATLLLLCTLSLPAAAGKHPNLAEGFQPGSVYQSNGIDTINAFNGNLTLVIPIGQPYPIGGGLSYQLRLYGNSTMWEAEERFDLDTEPGVMGDCDNDANKIGACIHAFPDRRANAGFGWTLSLGRLYPPAEFTNDQWQSTNETGGWMYESPDGSEHRFAPLMTGVDEPETDVYYGKEGSYLRLRKDATLNRYHVEFPNGEVHTFMPNDDPGTTEDDDDALIAPWLLEKIGNQFSANALTVSYRWNANHMIDQWTLSDGYRSHVVSFALRGFESGVLGVATPNNRRMLVTNVDVAAFGGATASYVFTYENDTLLPRPAWHTIPTSYASQKSLVQILRSLTLPDGTQYQFSGTGVFAGVTLPMGGRIDWTWGTYGFPKTGEHGVPYLDSSQGVYTRTLKDRNNVAIGTWTYAPALDEAVVPNNGNPPKELRNTITDPLGTSTEQYFNVHPSQTSADVEPPIDYGKPFTRKTSVVRAPGDTVWLSSRTLAAGATTPLRSTYVRHDAKYEEIVASRSIYHDDDKAYLDTDRSDPDGLGHYRTTKTSGTGVPTRQSTTAFNPGSKYPNDVLVPPSNEPWLLDTFTSKTTTEGAKTLKSEYHFDAPDSSTPGFLRRTRTIMNTATGARGGTDVIVAYTPDARGNVTDESHYGGDGASPSLQTGELKDVPLSSRTPQYRIQHQYSNGSLSKSRYHTSSGPMSFYDIDADIDATGLVSTSRDSAGVSTAYQYDPMGRLKKIAPAGRAWTNYAYPSFTTGAGSNVDDDIVVTQHQPGTTSTSMWLAKSRFQVDSLGWVNTEWTEMPGGLESRRETRYNALGWKLGVSEPGRAVTLPETTYTYDPFGRVLTRTTPDGAVVTSTYTGIRKTQRTAYVSTAWPSTADTAVTTTEEMDLYGRLIRVTERSGDTSATSPIGANVVTEYEYDPAGRLTGVLMNRDGSAVQERAFDYDGRGFLRWESHPEAGITSYTYDSRGNVTSRTQGAAKSPFDLEYTYDAAGRVLTVKGRNPWNGSAGQPPFRLMKSFEYGRDTGAATTTTTLADLRNGKLVRAIRFNYGLDVNDPVYRIDQVYEYRDVAGRTSGRTTVVTRADAWSSVDLKEVRIGMTYDALDLPVTISYPMCLDCGGPPVDPTREQIVRTYDHGRLVKLERPAAVNRQGQTIPAQTFVSNVTFWPNGMRHQLVHGNQIVDTQTVGDMPRIAGLSFGRYDRCVQPTFSLQPVSVTGGSAVTLSVTVAGTGPFTYEWWNATNGTVAGGDAPTLSVNPTTTTEYYVIVTGACGIARSHTAKVSIPDCAPPSTGSIQAVRQPDGSWILRPNPTARSGAQYEWRRLPSNTIIGTAETQAVGALSASTTFRLTISDSCGSASSDVTVQVPLPITKSDLKAAWNTGSIVVTWPAVAGATRYVLERRSGAVWEVLRNDLTTLSYTDTAIQSNRTYAYRLYAVGNDAESDYSNADVATTRTFTEAVPNTPVTSAPADSMLAAVNSVRAAAGWSALTWNNILAPNDALPQPSSPALARHVMSCRARMNEALQALGSRTVVYTTPDLRGAFIAAADLNDVLAQAK